MVLLSVVGISLLSLSTVSLRRAGADDAMLEARANARLALTVAIGKLQKNLGPDRRISARALTLSQDSRISTSSDATMTSSNPRAWWVGVAGTDQEFGLDSETAVSGSNPAVVWLVSGLDSSAAPANQLTQPFSNPVELFGENSIDLAMTGGQPLEAGIVEIVGSRPDRVGGYAYFVDDEGMKAQLVASNRDVRNDVDVPAGGGVIPGSHDPSVLDGMAGLEAGDGFDNYRKLFSSRDLVLLGLTDEIAREKALAYTTMSRGVLCDVKDGGLKRDLTAAFENDATFAEVFPRGDGNYTADYLCIDADKLSQSSELANTGYIHWEMFKDYYNIKKYIKTQRGDEYLDPVIMTKYRFMFGTNSDKLEGLFTPHSVRSGPGAGLSSPYNQVPYGDFQTYSDFNPTYAKNSDYYKHSPVIPVLQRMQVKAWLEKVDQKLLRPRSQFWMSYYNPFNISLFVKGDEGGPRVEDIPQVNIKVPGYWILNNRQTDLDNGWGVLRDANVYRLRKFHARNGGSMIPPGRAQCLSYSRDADVDEENIEAIADEDAGFFDDNVQDLTVESAYRNIMLVPEGVQTSSGPGSYNNLTYDQAYNKALTLPQNLSYDFEIFLDQRSFFIGADDHVYPGAPAGSADLEVAQYLYAPFGWEKVGNSPGRKFSFQSVPVSELTLNNTNHLAAIALKTRITRESGTSSIRPLIDANVRFMIGNGRWDSPLNLSEMAVFTPENSGEELEEDLPIFQMSTVDAPKGYSYWGAGRFPSEGNDQVILFDIPREDLVSLGQLQHASAGRFSYEPSYIVGNSYANPRIPQDKWVDGVSDTYGTTERGYTSLISGQFNLYDASYLVNEVMWDGYTFTTIPQVADNAASSLVTDLPPTDASYQSLLAGDALLPNPRYIPYQPAGSAFNMVTLQMASSQANRTGAFYTNAGHLMIDGAFNVNSISVDAWEAFLSGTYGLAIQKRGSTGDITGFETSVDGVRFPRLTSTTGDALGANDSDEENFCIGYRALEQQEVRDLAQAIVDEVVERGPFLTMGDFVNRRLETGELGERGALQAALDATVNSDLGRRLADDAENGQVPDDASQGAGFPGHMLQGDVLQALAPSMNVRSDTFTIRAYGESVNASDGKVLAQAWCEAVVQRYPDPADYVLGSFLASLVDPGNTFGRKFKLLSFRWLNPKEI